MLSKNALKKKLHQNSDKPQDNDREQKLPDFLFIMLRIRKTSTCGGRVKIRVQLSLNTSLKEPDLYILLKNATRYARIHKALGAKKHYFCKEPLFGERQFVIKKSRYIRFALT